MYIYTYVYVHVYYIISINIIYIYMYIYICICNVYIYIYTHVCMCICIYVCMCKYFQLCVNVHIYAVRGHFQLLAWRWDRDRAPVMGHGVKDGRYPLVNIQKTMENHHLYEVNHLFLWAIFNCNALNCRRVSPYSIL